MELLLSQRYLFTPSNALLSPCLHGFGGTILLFAICFLAVHISKIAMRGFVLYDTKRGNNGEKAPVSQAKTEQKTPNPEPVYYIVEKKRRRSKYSYGDPKEFRFK